ncbi:hypothetical protein ACK2SD_03030 [Pseudomonas sp. SC11]|uniref:hypothetical protein n=1 Tax=Pseudomonas sp. SC11 TaxID=326927 RepID=UPI000A5EA02E
MMQLENLIEELIAQHQILYSSLFKTINFLKEISNSAFTTSLAGAFAGAYAAQRTAERSKIREELIREVRNINSAVTLAISITNLGAAVKSQFLNELIKQYESDSKAYNNHVRALQTSQENVSPLEIRPNFTTLQELTPPISTLLEIVFSKITATGRAIASASALADALANHNYAVTKRNEIINKIANIEARDTTSIALMYLGAPNKAGKVDNQYGSTLAAIKMYTDDVIFFGVKLCEDLSEHGKLLVKNNEKYLKKSQTTLIKIDTTKLKNEGFLPKDEEYQSWLSGFQSEAKEKPKNRFYRLFSKKPQL